MDNKSFIFFFILLLSLGFLVAQQTNTAYSFNTLQLPTFNNNTAFVNSSQFWNTISLGALNDANSTQFNGIAGTLTIDETWLSSVYIPYIGATADVDLGIFNLTTNKVSSQSGTDLILDSNTADIILDTSNDVRMGDDADQFDMNGIDFIGLNSMEWTNGNTLTQSGTDMIFNINGAGEVLRILTTGINVTGNMFADNNCYSDGFNCTVLDNVTNLSLFFFNLSGTNADQNLNIGTFNLTATSFLINSTIDHVITNNGETNLSIQNSNQDSDIIFQINDGGVLKDFINIESSQPSLMIDGGVMSIGAVQGLVDVTATINGSANAFGSAMYFHPTLIDLNDNFGFSNLFNVMTNTDPNATLQRGVWNRMQHDATHDNGVQEFRGTQSSYISFNVDQDVLMQGFLSQIDGTIVSATNTPQKDWYGYISDAGGALALSGDIQRIGIHFRNFGSGTEAGGTVTDTAILSDGGKWTMDNDLVDGALEFGEGQDAQVGYNGSDFIIDPDAVGSGKVFIGLTGDDDMHLNDLEVNTMQNNNNSITINDEVIINSGTSQVYPLDLIGLDPTATDGLQIRMSNVLTNATTKLFGMSGRHYNNEEIDISILVGQSTAGATTYFWGGGSVNFNAATMQRFYASSSNTFNSNTEILRLDNTLATIFTDLNVTNNSILEIQCLNFSNGDTICGNSSIDISINGTSLARFAVNNTLFIGDVENLHNINNFSRFFEKNINSGNFATSVFSAENDQDFNVHLGITSSGFNNGNIDISANQGFLFFQTPNTTLFANGFDMGFKWLNNPSGTRIFTDTTNDLMTLSNDGSLNVASNISASNITIREYAIFTHQTTPAPITGHTQMYCKSNNRCFIMKDDGTERRLLDGGGGSFTVDEEIIFDNYTRFNFNVTLNATLITNDGGRLWSNATCIFLASPDGSNTLEVCNS